MESLILVLWISRESDFCFFTTSRTKKQRTPFLFFHVKKSDLFFKTKKQRNLEGF